MARKEIIKAALAKKRVQHGAYVYKPIISVISICSCGGKYVSTRTNQLVCLRCIQKKAGR